MSKFLNLCASNIKIEYGREAFTNSGTAAVDVVVSIDFDESFSSAPYVSLGTEANLNVYVSSIATTSGFSITASSVPAGSTVYVNWIAIGK